MPPIISNTIIAQSFDESIGEDFRRWFEMTEEVVQLRRPKQEAAAGLRSLGRFCFTPSSSHKLPISPGDNPGFEER